MAQVNTVFNLPIEQRKELDKMLVTSVPMATICRKFGIKKDSLTNYRDRNLAPSLARQAEKSLENHHQALLDRLVGMLTKCESIIESAERDGHRSLTLKSLDVMNKIIPNLAKTIGMMYPPELQGLEPGDLQAFLEWKSKKDRPVDPLALDKLTPAERNMVESVARQRLKEQTDLGLYSRDHIVDAEIVDPIPSPPPPRKMRRKPKPPQ